jgi:hypothetical protein
MASSGFLASNNFFLSLIDKLEQKKQLSLHKDGILIV